MKGIFIAEFEDLLYINKKSIIYLDNDNINLDNILINFDCEIVKEEINLMNSKIKMINLKKNIFLF